MARTLSFFLLFLSWSHYCIAGPSPYGGFVGDFPKLSVNTEDYRYAPIYKLNDPVTLKWDVTDLLSKSNYNITLWQELFVTKSARQNSNPIYVSGPSSAQTVTYKWILQTFDYDITISPVFFLAATVGGDIKFSSAYFNLTAAADSSTSAPSSTVSGTNRAAASSATSSSSLTQTNPATTGMTTSASSAQASAAPVEKKSSGNSLPIGLGVGLGVGIPLLIIVTAVATVILLRRQRGANTEQLAKDVITSPTAPSIQEMSASGGPSKYGPYSDANNGMHGIKYQPPVEIGNSR